MLSHSAVSDSLQSRGLSPARIICPWDSLGNNARMASCFLLQGIFPTQGLHVGFCTGRYVLCHWATWEAPDSDSAARQSQHNKAEGEKHQCASALFNLWGTWGISFTLFLIPEWFTFWTQKLPLNFQRSRDPVHGLKDSIFIKIQLFPNWSIYSIVISIKILADLLSENDKLVPKFIRDAKTTLKKESKRRRQKASAT